MKERKSKYFIRNDIIYVEGYINKKRYRLSTGKEATKLNIAWIKRNCNDVLLKLYNEKQSNNEIKINSENFDEFATESLKRNGAKRKDSTNEDYLSVYNRYIKIHFKDYSITDIKKAQLQNWQNLLLLTDLSAGRIKFVRAVFSGILTDAMQNEIISENPFKYVEVPSKDNESEEDNIKPFSLEEIEKILKLSIGQWKNIFTVLFFTGMRTGECWGLKWSDINFTTKSIHIKRAVRHGKIGKPKTKNSTRVIDMLPIVEEALRNQKSHTLINDDFVFLNKNKEHFKSAQHITRDIWTPTLKLAGLDFRVLYQCRHSFASLMISNGEDIIWVSKMLGHSTPRMTLDVYSKYVPELNKERATFLNNFKVKTGTDLAQSKFKLLRSS